MDDDKLKSILELVALNQDFLIQTAAEVALLQAVISSANPKAYVELRKQFQPNLANVQRNFAKQERLLAQLRQSLLKKPN